MGNVDWQSVVVTVVAFGALVVLARPWLPSRRASRTAGACPSCAAGQAACSKAGHERPATPDGALPLTLVRSDRAPRTQA